MFSETFIIAEMQHCSVTSMFVCVCVHKAHISRIQVQQRLFVILNFPPQH